MTNRPSRRTLLQGLAGLPLMAALPPTLTAPQHENTKKVPPFTSIKSLVVLFHGLFAFVVWPDHLLILAPRVLLNDHVYKVGNWTQELDVADGGRYFLNVERTTKPTWGTFDIQKHPVMKKVGNFYPNSALVKYGVYAPFPDDVVQLRCLNKIQNFPFFDYGIPKAPDTIPLVTALVYKNFAPGSQPSVEPNLWKAPLNQDVVHLHVRAEPQDEHSSPDGITSLGSVFGLSKTDLALNCNYTDCFVCPDTNPTPPEYTITTAEECTLYEIAKGNVNPCVGYTQICTTPSRGRPVNCASIIVDNT
jgi:hypothetical protein